MNTMFSGALPRTSVLSGVNVVQPTRYTACIFTQCIRLIRTFCLPGVELYHYYRYITRKDGTV